MIGGFQPDAFQPNFQFDTVDVQPIRIPFVASGDPKYHVHKDQEFEALLDWRFLA